MNLDTGESLSFVSQRGFPETTLSESLLAPSFYIFFMTLAKLCGNVIRRYKWEDAKASGKDSISSKDCTLEITNVRKNVENWRQNYNADSLRRDWCAPLNKRVSARGFIGTVSPFCTLASNDQRSSKFAVLSGRGLGKPAENIRVERPEETRRWRPEVQFNHAEE